jgi:hypothetical protein
LKNSCINSPPTEARTSVSAENEQSGAKFSIKESGRKANLSDLKLFLTCLFTFVLNEC